MGDVRNLWIPGPVGRIEAALRTASPARAAAVLAHPHPLHGGTLHNPPMFHIDRGLNQASLTTLRFNFRGVGSSEGRHDEGIGEVDDVAAALAWLRGIEPGVPLLLVGYSFGAWCGIRHAVDDPSVSAMVAIGLPVNKYPFPELKRFGRPLAVVQGAEDEFGDLAEVRDAVVDVRPAPELHFLPGATHLFPGRVREAAVRVVDATLSLLEVADRNRA